MFNFKITRKQRLAALVFDETVAEKARQYRTTSDSYLATVSLESIDACIGIAGKDAIQALNSNGFKMMGLPPSHPVCQKGRVIGWFICTEGGTKHMSSENILKEVIRELGF